jgi:hypothetical protein
MTYKQIKKQQDAIKKLKQKECKHEPREGVLYAKCQHCGLIYPIKDKKWIKEHGEEGGAYGGNTLSEISSLWSNDKQIV